MAHSAEINTDLYCIALFRTGGGQALPLQENNHRGEDRQPRLQVPGGAASSRQVRGCNPLGG
jgi:hypothetical protein